MARYNFLYSAKSGIFVLLLAEYKFNTMDNIIGRTSEIAILKEVLASPNAELLAMYGRRRVGKTFLIRNIYEKEIVFEFTGLKEVSLAAQLENFSLTLVDTFQLKVEIATPKNWLQAFRMLINLLEDLPTGSKKVIFLDEFPWLDMPKSGFLAAFDHFWNAWASRKNDILVVICGSAASWMIQNVVSNKGGLHNRLTQRIRLLPFNLYETELFLKHKNVHLDHYQLLQIYMVTGGIPHYLRDVKTGESSTQTIDRLCFTKDGWLQNEFKNLYIALFENADNHIAVVRSLANKPMGMTRNEIMTANKLSSGGSLTKLLDELLESGFVSIYTPFGKTSKDGIYKLSDEYSLFYLKFIENSKVTGVGTWLKKAQSASYKSWSGLAFENICLKHIPQIKKALGISGIYCEESIWRFVAKNDEKGTQIDFLLDRQDNCINLLELKFSNIPFTIDKKYASELQNKRFVFLEKTKTRKTVFTTMLTTFGVAQNEHYTNNVQQQLTMKILFENL